MSRTAIFIFFLLVIFGLVMIASAGVVEGQKKCGSPYCYLFHQIEYGFIPGLFAFFIFSKIDYKKWKTLSLPILLATVGLLILVFVPGIGLSVRGAQRWIDLNFFSIQPSEILKLALIIYLAAWFGSNLKNSNSWTQMIPFFLILGFTGFLLLLQPDFGTLGIILIIGILMYFFSGAKLRHFFVLFLIIAILMGILALAAPYRFNRIKAFINPQVDKQDTSYHINQSLISIGSGGIFGLGYGQSKQKFNYLPEPVGDSIFAVAVEELGLIGGAAIVLAFAVLVFSLVSVAQNTSDSFGRLLVLGFAVWIGGQAFINIAAITGLIPLTGVPLPLISYGSSSLVSLMIGMGIVKNVTK